MVGVVRLVSEQEAGSLTLLFAEIRERVGLGVVPAVFRAMAAVGHDVLLQNWTAYRYTVLEGVLPRDLKEMVGLAVARAAGCPYGVRLHSEALAQLGLPDETICSLAEHGDAGDLPLRERAILHFVGDDSRSLDERSLEVLGYTDEEVAEVTDSVLLAEGLCRLAQEVGLSEFDL